MSKVSVNFYLNNRLKTKEFSQIKFDYIFASNELLVANTSIVEPYEVYSVYVRIGYKRKNYQLKSHINRKFSQEEFDSKVIKQYMNYQKEIIINIINFTQLSTKNQISEKQLFRTINFYTGPLDKFINSFSFEFFEKVISDSLGDICDIIDYENHSVVEIEGKICSSIDIDFNNYRTIEEINNYKIFFDFTMWLIDHGFYDISIVIDLFSDLISIYDKHLLYIKTSAKIRKLNLTYLESIFIQATEI